MFKKRKGTADKAKVVKTVIKTIHGQQFEVKVYEPVAAPKGEVNVKSTVSKRGRKA